MATLRTTAEADNENLTQFGACKVYRIAVIGAANAGRKAIPELGEVATAALPVGPSSQSCSCASRDFARRPFERILDELWDLHLRKGADYGTDVDCLANIRTSAEFGVEPWRYAILRANEKVSRLKRFARDKTLANETVEDSLLDLASQAILALVLLRE